MTSRMFEAPVMNMSIAFETESNPGMRHSPYRADRGYLFVVGRIHVVPAHIFLQHFKSLFTLAAADDLAVPGTSKSMAATVLPSSFERM